MSETKSPDDIVGHKTHTNERGEFYHTPLTRGEADELMAMVEQGKARRAALMPDEAAARKMLFDAYLRLKEFGWNDAIYCPKDGSTFDVIEAGSAGVHACHYQGEWPTGTWWIESECDLWPSRPALYRKRPSTT